MRAREGSIMQTYREFRPTGFDAAGLGADRLGIGEWYVIPAARNRDSGPLEESNFQTALQAVGGEGADVQVHRFGHWACGWFEIVIVRPATAAAERAAELEARLEDYPVLDEEDYSRREYERAAEYWVGMGIRERAEWCARYDVSIFAARRGEIPDDPRGELISALAE